MVTIRTLSVTLLLALCFAACACAAAARKPTNRYISYAGVPHARGENDAGHSGTPPGCSAITKCAGRRPPVLRRPPKAGATTAAATVSQSLGLAALPTDTQTTPTKGGAKALAAGSKGGYITHAAMSGDRLCGRFGCPNSQPRNRP